MEAVRAGEGDGDRAGESDPEPNPDPEPNAGNASRGRSGGARGEGAAAAANPPRTGAAVGNPGGGPPRVEADGDDVGAKNSEGSEAEGWSPPGGRFLGSADAGADDAPPAPRENASKTSRGFAASFPFPMCAFPMCAFANPSPFPLGGIPASRGYIPGYPIPGYPLVVVSGGVHGSLAAAASARAAPSVSPGHAGYAHDGACVSGGTAPHERHRPPSVGDDQRARIVGFIITQRSTA